MISSIIDYSIFSHVNDAFYQIELPALIEDFQYFKLFFISLFIERVLENLFKFRAWSLC